MSSISQEDIDSVFSKPQTPGIAEAVEAWQQRRTAGQNREQKAAQAARDLHNQEHADIAAAVFAQAPPDRAWIGDDPQQ